jgi:hypothetical protein
MRLKDQIILFCASFFIVVFPWVPHPYQDVIGTVGATVILVGFLWICWQQAKKKMPR